MKDRARSFFSELQDKICATLEQVDGSGRFLIDRWDYAPGEGPGAGGGNSRVLTGGTIFEKAGVNVSALNGELTERLAERLEVTDRSFFATGISLVIHPESPFIPTVHMNLRYLELLAPGGGKKRAWFGGGADLTPYYRDDAAASDFHRALEQACEGYRSNAYAEFKQQCDDYFYLPHRGESRGVGGIFFDYLDDEPEATFDLVQRVGRAFDEVYAGIVQERRDRSWNAAQREWQLHRRGRYVEFNLIYDRGTLFGLETRGRTESILMSLPPEVRWTYDYQPEKGSPEEELLELVRRSRPN